MSKSRGTFITMETYARHLDPDYLRYYYASKLGPNIDDIDLNFADFIARVNSDLVGKLVNIASRCAGFIHRLNGGVLAEQLADSGLLEDFATAAEDVAADYESRNFARAMRRIMALADQANQYIDSQKPWILARDESRHAEVLAICTLGLNLFRSLIVLLKPVIPAVAERAEEFLSAGTLSWPALKEPQLGTPIAKFELLLGRIEESAVDAILAEAKQGEKTSSEDIEVTPQIDLETFLGIDLRVAEILSAEFVDGADKLLVLRLDLDGETRTVFAGIRSAYEPATLVGRHVVVVANLKPRKMRFGVSEGMILAAGPGGKDIFLLSPDDGAKPGMRVS
jgi:methionyl-tRNA synthetase